MSHRVVVTGMGVISPVGTGKETFWDALTSGQSGISPVTRFDVTGYATTIGGEIKDFDPALYMDRKEARRTDRYAQLAIAAAKLAIEDSGLVITEENADRIGVVVSSGVGGMDTFEQQCKVLIESGPRRVSPLFIPMMIGNIASGQISIIFGVKGPNYSLVTACATGTHSIGDAARIIERGDADIMIAGGSEAAITPLSYAGFCSIKAMSTKNDNPTAASRPFDALRDGFVMGEGSGVLILESLESALSRGAHIYGEIVGYGLSGDAHHLVAPAPGGVGAAKAIKMALDDAGASPEDVDYINAHGTSTDLNDKYETAAIKAVFGEYAYNIPISSTKSMTGHLLGAAGAIEAIACLLAIRDNRIPPTINYEHPDPDCDLDYVPNKARDAKVDLAISNSFGFGGHNAVIAIKRYIE